MIAVCSQNAEKFTNPLDWIWVFQSDFYTAVISLLSRREVSIQFILDY